MNRRLAICLSITLIVVIVVSTYAAIKSSWFAAPVAAKKPFYVGVTYCGNNVTEAEQLIDRVKVYTNLLVVQSGPLMDNFTRMEQICDYAVNSGLNIIVYYSRNGDANNTCSQFANVAPSRYGSHFLGLYFNDEPGGKLLDHYSNMLLKVNTDDSISVDSNGQYDSFWNTTTSISKAVDFLNSGEIDIWASYINFQNPTDDVNNETVYCTNGTIYFSSTPTSTESKLKPLYLWYLPNGTVLDKLDKNGVAVTGYGSISGFEPYQQVWDSRPIKTYSDLANDYVYTQRHYLGTDAIGNSSNVNLLTSDYALYWFDYKAGYNTLFAELFGTKTDSQTLALIKGAADMQGKSWGAMIEWANRTTITLQTGTQIYNEMRQAYRDGAEYAVVFNYQGEQQVQNNNSTTTFSSSGLLQDTQFAAMEKFWSNVVENPKETNNVKAKDALVLPASFGGGMRNKDDGTWGYWNPDNTTQQVWNTLQSSLAKYGSKLDIVYDDSAYPTAGRYQHVVYWNQTT